MPICAATQSADAVVPELVDSLIQISRSYTAETEFELAFTASAQAGKVAENYCGKESVAYAAYSFNEGRIRYFMGRNKEALPWYIQSRELRGEILGTDDVEYGKSCNNLAIAYDVMGRYEEAEPLYLEALTIREATAGKMSATYCNALANLASMYQSMGEFEVAERMTLDVLENRRQLLGENNLYFAQSLMNLGSIRYETFNYEEAKKLYGQARQIIEQEEELDFYTYVKVLDNLGAVHENLREFEKAKSYYQEAKDLIQEVLGEQTLDYALSLTHLASVALRAEQYNESETHLKECLKVLEQADLRDSEEYGLALLDQSKIYFIRGQNTLALQTIQRAIDNFDQSLSPSNSQYLYSLWQQAAYFQVNNELEAATQNLRRIAQLEATPLASAVRYLSDRELTNYTKTYRDYLAQSLALAERQPQIADLCYDKILLYKGFLLNNVVELRKELRQDENSAERFQQLRGLYRRLSAMYVSRDAEASEIEVLESDAQALEKELIRNSRYSGTLSEQVHWQDIQEVLEEGEAAIEFATYEIFSTTGASIAVHNAALLLLPGEAQPIFIQLGTQAAFDQLLQETGSNKAGINALYSWDAQGQQLYNLLWAPIDATFQKYPNVEKIYFAKSGLIHRLNLAAVPTGSGSVLSKHFRLVALSSTRALVNQKSTVPPTQSYAVLFGGIDYGNTGETNAGTSSEIRPSPVPTTRDGYHEQLRGYDPTNGYWQALPWTEVEVNYADELLRAAKYHTELKSGRDATETALKELCQADNSPSVLHLATHGFFFDTPSSTHSRVNLPFVGSQRSMIRSGLILADGNYAWANGDRQTSATEDGILTAFELSQLDLPQTELVILSACETGLGDIQTTEGVYGLQRALKLAGVHYVIMSLWQVPDYQAQAFMSSFYIAWLEEKKTIPEAFRNAQAYMRARYKNAFEWAGFVLLE